MTPLLTRIIRLFLGILLVNLAPQVVLDFHKENKFAYATHPDDEEDDLCEYCDEQCREGLKNNSGSSIDLGGDVYAEALLEVDCDGAIFREHTKNAVLYRQVSDATWYVQLMGWDSDYWCDGSSWTGVGYDEHDNCPVSWPEMVGVDGRTTGYHEFIGVDCDAYSSSQNCPPIDDENPKCKAALIIYDASLEIPDLPDWCKRANGGVSFHVSHSIGPVLPASATDLTANVKHLKIIISEVGTSNERVLDVTDTWTDLSFWDGDWDGGGTWNGISGLTIELEGLITTMNLGVEYDPGANNVVTMAKETLPAAQACGGGPPPTPTPGDPPCIPPNCWTLPPPEFPCPLGGCDTG